MRRLKIVIGFVISLLSIMSCGQGDDNPCNNGRQYVFPVGHNQLMRNFDNAKLVYSVKYLGAVGLPDDTFKFIGKVDTMFRSYDQSPYYYDTYCYECGAVAEYYNFSFPEKIDSKSLSIEYEACLGYIFKFDKITYIDEEPERISTFSNEDQVIISQDSGLVYFKRTKRFILKRLK